MERYAARRGVRGMREFEQKEKRLQGSEDVTVQREADTPDPRIQDTPLYPLLGTLGSTRYLSRAGMMAESRLLDNTPGSDILARGRAAKHRESG